MILYRATDEVAVSLNWRQNVLTKNDVFELEITDFGNDGEGVGRYEGMTFFVKGAIIGDVIRAGVLKLKKTYGYARIVEIIKESPFRTEPPCPVAGKCGGCSLMNLSYERQLKYKEDKIISCLTRIGGINPEEKIEILPIIGAQSPLRYRNKAQLPVGQDEKGNPVTGFYAGHSHNIIDCEDCLLQPQIDSAIIHAVKKYMEKCGVSAYNEETGKGLVRHVLVRVGFRTGEIMVCVIINGDSLPKEERLIDMLKKTVSGCNSAENKYILKNVSININKENTNVIMGPKVLTIFGEDYISDYIGDLKFRISPHSFFQVNPEQTKKLYDTALSFAGLTGTETVWDLYCGTGTISLFLAGSAKKVYGIEIVPEAIADARENAKDNNIDNTEFFVGAAEEVLPDYLKKHPESRADVVVLDPPRKGCDEKLINAVITLDPQRIVYVSCDPATLARDIAIFSEKGYRLKKVRGCDMFPHTSHVETVCLLSRKA